jgi:osmoprotectant transport system substrate-binding protein
VNRTWLATAVLALLAALPACVGRAPGAIKVGSKDFTEQFIIGEMYAIALERAGLEVERRLNLGGTPVAQAGITSGEIDLYPEYTGTALLTVLKLPAAADRDSVYRSVADGYRNQFELVWLAPSPMNNAQAIAMPRDAAARLGIRTLSDFAAKAGELRLAGPPEFAEREDGLPGLERAYGNFALKEYIAVDPGLKYEGLEAGRADAAVAFGTDGEIEAYDLVVLEDDRKLFPPYQVAPVVRADVLEANPKIREALDALAPKLTDEVMRRLNSEVSGQRREPADVARAFMGQT